MDIQLEYKSTFKSKPFFYKEMKKVASLKSQGIKDFEIKEKANLENIFQVDTVTRRSEIASTALQRLSILDDFLLNQLANGNMETSKQIAIYTIMKTDKLFSEYMYEVFREKILLRDFTIQDKDFNLFFDRKKEQSERVKSWDEYTFYKLKQVYIRCLYEAGLIKNQKGLREIVKPIMDEQVASHIKDIGDAQYLHALTGDI